jgi:hypothetical protein
MALAVNKARPIEREVKVPSGIKGYEDRVFLIGINSAGITLREKGKREYRSMQFANFARWMFTHAPLREG